MRQHDSFPKSAMGGGMLLPMLGFYFNWLYFAEKFFVGREEGGIDRCCRGWQTKTQKAGERFSPRAFCVRKRRYFALLS
jgi:hypothetical protein